MFQEVDAALVALIKDEAIGDADVAIALDVPNRPWFAAVQSLTVNVFLYDVRENVARRDVMYEPVLDETGRIVGRRAPAMRYDLYYLLSVWGTTDPALEHQVMAALLVGLGRHDVFPEARVPEQHRELGLWHLSVASGGKRMMPGNFGGEMKLQAEVSVTVPLPPRIPLSVGPPVDRPMDIRMAGAGGQREQVQGRPPAPGDPRAAGAQPGQRPGQQPGQQVPRQGGPVDPARQREQLAQAVARGAAGPPGAGRPPGAGGPPQGQRPGQASGAGGPARPADPMAVLRNALAQAAQAQAALAQAQALVATAMSRPAGPPGEGQRPPGQQGQRPPGQQAQPPQGQPPQGQPPQGQPPQGQAAPPRPAGGEQPVAEQPVAEQPVAEQPVAEQPVAEQPTPPRSTPQRPARRAPRRAAPPTGGDGTPE